MLVRVLPATDRKSSDAQGHQLPGGERSYHRRVQIGGDSDEEPPGVGPAQLDRSGEHPRQSLPPQQLAFPAMAPLVPRLFRAYLPETDRDVGLRAPLLELGQGSD